MLTGPDQLLWVWLSYHVVCMSPVLQIVNCIWCDILAMQQTQAIRFGWC